MGTVECESTSGRPRPSVMPIGMTREDAGDGLDGLRRDLQARRKASLGTNHPVHQTAVAEAMQVSAAYVSRLENGQRSIRRLSGNDVWEFLRGYGPGVQPQIERVARIR